ncbi:translocation/assembly module TamB domain-containing protein [Halobacteriovorax sp. GB3]|uniref:translocation/assembly module TamB domain-containing protein n=1 Tax=Halobacteriovorax sp. GB3 TaxID=2719615 RepID=UPI0023611B41|nr:translocation/assembly module TamB domain-containing protein [Halobacteriovorax sp. GB3]MDD0854591.1 translocation/assembly module TamB domain-containing protein [Halobacteriovorax sp. GB3]
MLQSEMVGEYLSKQVQKIAQDKADLSLEFKQIGVGFFPPATILKDIKVKKKLNDGWIDFQSKEVALKFGILDFFKKELSISSFDIYGAEIYGSIPESKESSKREDFKLKNIFQEIRQAIDTKLPVKVSRVYVNKTSVFINDAIIYIDNIELSDFSKSIEVNGKINSVRSGETNIDKYLQRDSIDFQTELSANKLRIKNLMIEDGLNKLSLSGEIVDDLKNGTHDLKMKYSGGIQDIIDEIKGFDEKIDGYVEFEVTSKGNVSDPQADFVIKSWEGISSYFHYDYFESKGRYKDGNLSASKAFLKRGEGSIENSKPIEVNINKLDQLKFHIKANDFHTNDALYAIKDSLDGLKGFINGELEIEFIKDTWLFHILSGTKLKQTKYVLDEQSPVVLSPKDITFSDSQIVLNEDLSVFFRLDAISGSYTKFNVTGKVGNNTIFFELANNNFDFAEFGKIMEFPIDGKGKAKVIINGNYQGDVTFNVDLDLEDFGLLDFKTKKAKGNIFYDLSRNKILINDTVFKFDSTDGNAEGFIDFSQNNLDIKFDIPKITYLDMKYITEDFFKKIPLTIPEKIRANAEVDMRLSGSLDDVKLKGEIDLEDIDLYGETFEDAKANFSIDSRDIFINDVVFKKSNGKLAGNIHFYQGEMDELNIRLNSFRLKDSDFYRLTGLGLDGFVKSNISLKKKFGESIIQGDISLLGSQINNVKVGDSELKFKYVDKRLNVRAEGLGDEIAIVSEINTDSKDVKINILFDFDNLREILGIISDHNIRDRSITGRVRGLLDSNFNYEDLKNINLNLTLDEFAVRRGGSTILLPGKKSLVLNNGIVTKGEFFLKHRDKGIKTVFSGSIEKGLRIEQELVLDADWAEVLTPKIHKISGLIRGRGVFVGEIGQVDNFYELEVSDVSAKIEKLPNVITDINAKIILDGKNLLLEEASAKFGGGIITSNGIVEFVFPFPRSDINIKVDSAYIPFFKKSGVVVSANSKIIGESFPYKIQGDVILKAGSYSDEFDEFSKSEIIPSSVYQFIPDKTNIDNTRFFDLDINLNTDSPLFVKNSLSDLQFTGKARITGSPIRPKVFGNLLFIPSISKFKFKGHEFILYEGKVNFDDESIGSTPELFFSAQSRINQYDIKLEVGGKSNDLNINLSAEPFLVQEDILSLLTLGVTSDISQGLQSRERQNVTTLGLGTLLVDQLKINEGLNSSLGLRLSVLPEFGENEDTLLQGKSGVSDGDVSRFKSATKVKVQKQITNSMDLSLSSTIGGSLEQKQEMNLNYNINKNLSVEGVYELKSSSEESVDTPDSIGADIKYRWSF